MKLRDLVANSLPRVRGRKKKTTPVGSLTPPIPTPPEPSAHRPCQDKSVYAMANTRTESRDRILESQGISEANWKGNALYRGIDSSTRGADIVPRFSGAHGIVTSHSAEGFSSQMMMLSRSYDSRMAVSDFHGSCSHMSSISETGAEPYAPLQEHHHCHYHQHKHHHHHHHHLLPKPMSPLVQNQQELSACGVVYIPGCKQEAVPKPEPGFFRKSFASFKGMRKSTTSRTAREAADNTPENVRCSVCPYPDTTAALSERKATEKRPVKPKRKGLKGFSRSKENKDMISIDKGDKSWFSDNDAQNVEGYTTARHETTCSASSTERPRVRECSVESCSSRLYGGSREGSCAREVDLTGFDSASLSGYESDLPRSKVHRSRSRIKTNPWLPSPQPSLSGGRRGENSDLRESREDIAFLDEPSLRFPRSASFENQRSEPGSFQGSSWNNDNDQHNIQRHRSLTPNDVKMTFACNKSQWWSPPGLIKGDRLVTDSMALKTAPTKLNDLNTEVPRSRPTSIVSPNSEFVKLADNLEQLANNISFEYEDMLDSTLESVSVYQEDGQVSIQELLTDEETCGAGKRSESGKLKSDVGTQSAHSPDSGIGGLGSSDGDDAGTPCALTGVKAVSMDCSPGVESFGGNHKRMCEDNVVLCVDLSTSTKNRNSDKVHSKTATKSSRSPSCPFPKSSLVSNLFRTKAQNSSIKPKTSWPKTKSKFDDESSATVSESDVDNTSYQDTNNIAAAEGNQKKRGSPLLRCKIETRAGSKTPSLMVDERLDIQFQPPHRYIHGSGVVMGSRVSMHEYSSKMMSGVNGPVLVPSRASDPLDVVPRRITRPCQLKTNPSSHPGDRRMNNMEKSSLPGDLRNSWSEELTFPRNITASECVESPTDNWRCDGDLCSSQDTVVLEVNMDRGSATDGSATGGSAHGHENKAANDLIRLGTNDLDSRFTDRDDVSLTQSTVDMASENTSLMDCNVDKLDASSNDQSFDMTDACVQTDFDDDFCRWDEAGSLENFEDKVMDPAESTRLWLLTGNMQGSADTGYSSLTRDSQILMDEDTLFLAGELEERAASERLSFAESCDQNPKSDKTPRSSFYNLKELDLSSAPGNSRSSPSEFRKGVNLKNNSSGYTPNPPETGRTLANRSIPQETVNQMFSNIELQFQEIFQQIYEHENGESKRSASGSSGTTVRSSISDLSFGGEKHSSGTFENPPKDAETGEKRNGFDQKENTSDRFSLHDYVNIPSSNCMNRNEQCQYSNDGVNRVERESSFKNVKSKSSNRSDLTQNVGHSGDHSLPTGPVRPHRPQPETADYLQFLKDAPLKRSHLKRPLFLVPGVGPVDMSSSEQVNMFANLNSPLTIKNDRLTGSPNTLSPTMSPLVTNCGKKQKFKTSSPKMLEDSLCQTDQSQVLSKGQTCYDYLNFQKSSRSQDTPNQNKGLLPALNKYRPPNVSVRHPNKSQDTRGSIQGTKMTVDLPPTALFLQTPATSLATFSTKTNKTPAGDVADIENVRSLAAKVMFLRREKDIVYKKIQEAQDDEASRRQQRLEIQRSMQAQRKEALLKTLHDLRDKLREQSQKLQLQENTRTV